MPEPTARSPAVAGVLDLAFREQVAFFRGKLGNLVPTQAWDDLKKAQHDTAFMVAGAARADLLADLAGAVDKAIADGHGPEWFRKNFESIVAKHGWTGWTGEGSKAGRAWRARVIYETNLATSYAAGRLAQLREGGFKFWLYKHSDSVMHPRPLHLAWNGMVLAADDPFWKEHFPPNGWGCRCRVVGVNNLDNARALGGDPGKKIDPDWAKLSAKTGEPVGIDKGWGYMPGRTAVDTVLALRDKLDDLPPAPSVALIQDWLASEAFSRWFAKPTGPWPLVKLPAADAEAIGAKKTVADLSVDTARKQALEHPELSVAEYVRAQGVIDNATMKAQDSATSMIYARVDSSDISGGYVLIVKATKTGQGLFVTSFRRLSRKEAERDIELRRLLKK